MNPAAFLTHIVETFKYDEQKAVKIYYKNSEIVLNIGGQTWSDITLDLCLEKVKQSFAIMYLENIEKK